MVVHTLADGRTIGLPGSFREESQMSVRYSYPEYRIDFTREKVQECVDAGIKLLEEVGYCMPNERFLSMLKGKPHIKIDGSWVKFDQSFSRQNLERIIKQKREALLAQQKNLLNPQPWELVAAGYSLMVRDVETDDVRRASCRDLREIIHLLNSYDVGGCYPVNPQDIPPIMQAIAIFKICWETSEKVKPYDLQNIDQGDYVYEMHKVMGKRMVLGLYSTGPMRLSSKDMDIFLKFYPEWKKGADMSVRVHNYQMLGITKPITATGCMSMYIGESLGAHNLFKAFDPEIDLPTAFPAGHPTDMRSAAWAYGHPRQHLFEYLTRQCDYALCGLDFAKYHRTVAPMETNSSAIDTQAGMEKMATSLTGALQGARQFTYAGTLAVDDLFSSVQFVIDAEIFEYIKELVGAFDPHPDVLSTDGMYDVMKDAATDKEEFLSHPHTVSKFRNIVPSSNLIRRERLRQWMSHGKVLKDWARDECLKRLKEPAKFHLAPEKQKALDEIYKRAERDLLK